MWGWVVGGVGSFWGGGEKGQGSDVVMEFLSDVLALRRHPTSPGGFLRLQVHESRRRELSAPLAGIQRRNLGLKWRSGAIPNFGAGHGIKSQPRFLFAIWTCRFASQPPCHRRVPGRRLRKETSPPTTELLVFVEPEGAK